MDDIEVILVDDHVIVRDGLKAVIERKAKDIKVVGEASNGDELLKMARRSSPDVYVMDISMPVLNGIETTRRVIKRFPKSRIIILSVHDEKNFVEKALKAGAKGYILKESATEEVIHAIREVHKDRFYLSPKVSKFIVKGFLGKRNHYEQHEEMVVLTEREREVLQLIAEGFSSKEIAGKLKLSLNTVHVHRNHLLQKLDVHKQADLIRYALKEGIASL